MQEPRQAKDPTGYNVRDLPDEEILPVLEQDRRWAAYPLCDLEPPYRQHARFIGAARAGRTRGLVLAYSPPEFSALQPCGEGDAIRAILLQVRDLPATPMLIARYDDLDAIEQRYTVKERMAMLRLAVSANDLRPAPATNAHIVSLGQEDLPALQALYTGRTDAVFTLLMFHQGYYVGAFVDGALVAAAGTHAITMRYGMGVIGNVFTHPAYRGRGLATATTGAVTMALRHAGIREIALNVREDNEPAIRAYHRLGFTLHHPFLEGNATLRGEPDR